MILAKNYEDLNTQEFKKALLNKQQYANAVVRFLKELKTIESWGYRTQKVVPKENAQLLALSYSFKNPFLYNKIQSSRVKDYLVKSLLDTTNVQEWFDTNPTCVTEDHIELKLYTILPKLGISIKDITNSCELIINVNSRDITDHCRLYYTLDVISKAVDQSCYDVNVENIAQCKLNYDLLVKKYDCKLTYSEYEKTLQSNLSSAVIENIYKSGAKLIYKVNPIIVLGDNEYDASTIKTNSGLQAIQDEVLLDLIGEEHALRGGEIKEVLQKSYCNLKL